MRQIVRHIANKKDVRRDAQWQRARSPWVEFAVGLMPTVSIVGIEETFALTCVKIEASQECRPAMTILYPSSEVC